MVITLVADEQGGQAVTRCSECDGLLAEDLEHHGMLCHRCGTFYGIDEVQAVIDAAQTALDLLAAGLEETA